MDFFDLLTAPSAAIDLRARYVVPPFSTLDARQGYWRSRAAAWKALGIRSEEGRDPALSLQGPISKNADFYRHKAKAKGAAGLTFGAMNGDLGKATTGTSTFDPTLTEILIRWYSPPGGAVLDPFAGGSVRGIIAAALGRSYTGIDLSARQVAANRDQWADIAAKLPAGSPPPTWVVGDSRTADLTPPAGGYDLILTCPPYADLEHYSDDPADLSAMSYPDFLEAYRDILRRSADALRDDRFAAVVVGEVRDKQTGALRGLVGDTVAALRDAGLRFYDEAILLTPVASATVRVGGQFPASRKLVRTHQHVLIAVKGDPAAATAACGDPGVYDGPGALLEAAVFSD